MGRKIRTGALLILVLAMIYTQQAVIYAQNEAEKNMKKTTESENSDGTNGEQAERSASSAEQTGQSGLTASFSQRVSQMHSAGALPATPGTSPLSWELHCSQVYPQGVPSVAGL